MKRSINTWQLVGFGVTSLVGTLLHFVYDWSRQSVIVAPFSAINESIWEHTKLLFVPLFLFAFIENAYLGKETSLFWTVKFKGTLLGLSLIPTLYYTYTGAFGITLDAINIAIFFIAAAATFSYEAHLFKNKSAKTPSPTAALTALSVIAVLYFIFTFVQPNLPLFRDPITGTFGI